MAGWLATFMNILYLILLTVTENSALKLLFYLFIYLGFFSLSAYMLAHFGPLTRSFARSLAHTSIEFVYLVSSCISYVFTFIYLKIDVCRFWFIFYSFHLSFALFRFPFDCSDRSDCVGFFLLFLRVHSCCCLVCSLYFHLYYYMRKQ